jgi:hypothetical protein
MKAVDTNSDDSHRDFALQLLKQHRRETQFQVHTINILTVYELEERGCKVVFDYSNKGLDMVSSPIPFGQLVTKTEWREHRWGGFRGFLGGFGLFLLLFTGYLAVVVLAVSLKNGWWSCGLLLLGAAVFHDSATIRERIIFLLIGVLLFGIGLVAKLLG